MKILKMGLATVVIAGFASTAAAQDTGAYINIGVDAFEFDAYTLSGKLGYKFTKNFAVEGQAGFGIIDDEETIGTAEFETGIDSTFAAFGVASFPASENFDIFARAGYHFTQVGVSGVVSGSVDVDGFAVGGGGQYFFSQNDGVRLEYTYFDTSSVTGSGGGDVVSLSYVRKF